MKIVIMIKNIYQSLKVSDCAAEYWKNREKIDFY